MKVAKATNLRRRQLDNVLGRARAISALPAPKGGWIREVRSALGMSAHQLGRRLGVSQPAVAQLEKAEEDGTITLNTLRRVAAALDCTLAYVLLPKQSLEATVSARAQKLAADMAQRVDDSMALEAQAVGKEFQAQQTAELSAELIRTLDRRLWNQIDETDVPERIDAA